MKTQLKNQQIAILGIDLAKTTYQVHGIDQQGNTILKQKCTRRKLVELLSNLKPCTVVMESCAGSNYFSRKFQGFGHSTKLIAAQFVKPFVKSNKNDVADAQAIAEAASRPSMRFVATKQVWQQDLQSLHRNRQRLIKNRTALMNAIRGILYEYGVVIPVGRFALSRAVSAILSGQDEDNDLTYDSKELLQIQLSELLALEEKIAWHNSKLERIASESQSCAKIMAIKGIGVITATTVLSAVGDPKQFKNGRQFAAWLGLVPKHSGTGGKNHNLGISKRGDSYLRALMVHGARSVLWACMAKKKRGAELEPLEAWVYRIHEKRGWNKASVALANKSARIVWALLSSKGEYDAKKTSGPMTHAA